MSEQDKGAAAPGDGAAEAPVLDASAVDPGASDSACAWTHAANALQTS